MNATCYFDVVFITSTSMRFFYLVKPVLGKWEVTFGQGGTRFVYESRFEALEVARGAAKMHWTTRNEPSGVLVEEDGDRKELHVFGE